MRYTLSSKATLYFVLRKAFVWLFISCWLAMMFGGVFLPASYPPGAARIALPLLCILAAVVAIDAAFCYAQARAYRVELGEQGIALDYGVLSTSHETLPYPRIQDIVITRNVLERVMGLSTLTIQNATGQRQRVPALDAQIATTLRDELLKRSTR
jgi:membrane protein YdbS with pleckstrin-like domain